MFRKQQKLVTHHHHHHRTTSSFRASLLRTGGPIPILSSSGAEWQGVQGWGQSLRVLGKGAHFTTRKHGFDRSEDPPQ